MKKLEQIKFLFVYAWKISKRYFLIIGFESIFSAFLPLVNIVGLGMVVNALMTNEPYKKVMWLIFIYLSVNLAFAIIGQILRLLDNIVMRIVSNVTQFDFARENLYINYHYVQDNSLDILRRKAMGIDPSSSVSIWGNFLSYIIQLVSIFYIVSLFSPVFTIILIFTSSLLVVLTFITRKNDFELSNIKIEDDRKLDYLYNVMTNYKFAKEVRLNNANSYVEKKYLTIFKEQINKIKAFYRKSLGVGLLSTFITICQTASMYFYFSYQVYHSQITIAEYTVLLGTATLLTSVLLSFFDNIAKLNQICGYVDFYCQNRDMIETKSIITQSNLYEEKNIDFSNATIKFENVSFVYPNSEKEVLKNINIEFKKGERLGIVGLNGSGKTTFVKLLTRIYDPTEGRITINGIDIREVPYLQYSSHIGIVLQDFLLFAYSIKDNIVLVQNYNENKLKTSIEKSGLKNKVDALKNGIDTAVYKELDDDGIEFSGGEGQKLALARAIYKDAELLILDEPTSTLDPIAEYDLFSKLNDIAENKTAIFISHRLSSTKFCDKIIVFEKGKIVECGNHKELIGKSGIYADLFNAQAKYYEEKEAALNI
jgi:ABC-type multidrug transport system fused ATPase/permease subunit